MTVIEDNLYIIYGESSMPLLVKCVFISFSDSIAVKLGAGVSASIFFSMAPILDPELEIQKKRKKIFK